MDPLKLYFHIQLYLMLLIEATKTSSFLHIQLQGQIWIWFCQNHIFENCKWLGFLWICSSICKYALFRIVLMIISPAGSASIKQWLTDCRLLPSQSATPWNLRLKPRRFCAKYLQNNIKSHFKQPSSWWCYEKHQSITKSCKV